MKQKYQQQVPVIVVIGSLHYDIMIDAPYQPKTGETLAGSRWYPKFGGKGGNQAVAVSRAGCGTRMMSAVGDDEFGSYLIGQLKYSGVSVEFVQSIAGIGSGMSVAISDNDGDYAAVIVSGANLEIDQSALNHAALWDGASMLLLQNEVSEELNLAAAAKAKQAGLQICYNAAPARPVSEAMASQVDILIVNEIEASSLCNTDVNSLDSASIAAVSLTRQYPIVVVTAGARGLAVASSEGDSFTMKALDVDVVSTHGAGDMFVGTMCASLAAGTNLHDAVDAANTAAGRHVSRQSDSVK